jgi:hypothetical protein
MAVWFLSAIYLSTTTDGYYFKFRRFIGRRNLPFVAGLHFYIQAVVISTHDNGPSITANSQENTNQSKPTVSHQMRQVSIAFDAKMIHDLIQLAFNLVEAFEGLFCTLDLGGVTTSQLASLEFGNELVHLFRITSTAGGDLACHACENDGDNNIGGI